MQLQDGAFACVLNELMHLVFATNVPCESAIECVPHGTASSPTQLEYHADQPITLDVKLDLYVVENSDEIAFYLF